MEFKHAVELLFTNMGQTLKILVWNFISLAITFGIGCALLIPCWNSFAATTDVLDYVSAISGTWNDFVYEGLPAMHALRDFISEISGVFTAASANAGTMVGVAFSGVFLYALYCFLIGLSFYPVADMLNNKMASNMSFGFASNMAMNAKKSVRFSLARLSISFPLDIVFLVIEACFVFGVFPKIGIWAFTLALLIAILYVASRAVLFAGWLPRMIYYPDENVYTNFFRSLSSVKANIKCLFKAYIITFSLVYICAVVFAFPTFGLLSIVMPPVYYIMIRAIELVGYYKMNGMNFYIDSNTVIDTTEYGYRKHNQGIE
ncbi:MAG: hypothetical protein MJ068_01165 [Clostridia bacterium]|nr:hypothetical protein [Clostridia bacterium]